MMNVNDRIGLEGIEAMCEDDASRYPDDYVYDHAGPLPSQQPTCRVTLKPDELALHQQLLEIAKATAPARSESFFG